MNKEVNTIGLWVSDVSRIKHLLQQFSQLLNMFPKYNPAHQANAF